MSTRAVLVALAAAVLIVVSAEAQAPQTFRAGVDLVRVDVSVVDRQGQPVRGLTAKDFTLRDNGDERPIVSFSTVEVPDADTTLAPWRREIRPDVITNDLAARRMVVLVLDDASGRSEPVLALRTREIAGEIIDALGPADLASVVFTAGRDAENFTDDRARLRRAIGGFTLTPAAEIPALCPSRRCVINTLARVSAALTAVPDRRKAIFYISTSGVGSAESASLDAVLQQASLANVAVYVIDPSGLSDFARVGSNPDPAAAARALRARHDSLRALADRTGGRAIVNSNDQSGQVKRWLEETSYYYLIGFQPDQASGDAGARRISVSVDRPGVEVRSRRSYYRSPPAISLPAIGDAPMDLREALLAPLPIPAVALGITAAPIASPDLSQTTLVVVANVRQAVPGDLTDEEIRTLIGAFDLDGRSQGWRQQTFTLTLPADSDGVARYGVLSAIELPPGSYELRLALARASDTRPGSVHTHVDVPDFKRDPLSMSGLILESTAASVTAPLSVVQNLLPLVPTALRDFRQADRAQVLVRVYQGGATIPGNVTLRGRVLDAGSKDVFDQTVVIEAVTSAETRAAEGVFELPLERLAPGPYLLIVEAAAGGRSVRRDLRFTMH